MYRVPDLARVFSSIHQAVIGLDSQSLQIVFANSAAKACLGFDPTGRAVKDILAEDILIEDCSNYMCGTTVLGRKAGISVVKEPDITLLFIDFLADEKPNLGITRHMIGSLRNSAMGLKMSADRCFALSENDKALGKQHVSILYHYYYSLLRTLIQIDSADLIKRGEMLFSPVQTDLVKLCSDLTDTVALFCSDTGVKISFTTPEAELFGVVDPAKIEQLLLNLFTNSLQHTAPCNSITLSLTRSGNRIILSLDDDGEGIPQDILSNIFNLPNNASVRVPRQRGNGLGLYISLGIAQLHKGVMLIESREGEGTRVRVMLPTDETPAPKFSCPEVPYRHNGVSSVLMELSDILQSKNYGPTYED